jgi:hypothetical protein
MFSLLLLSKYNYYVLANLGAIAFVHFRSYISRILIKTCVVSIVGTILPGTAK